MPPTWALGLPRGENNALNEIYLQEGNLMNKTKNVKATQLMVDDHLKVGGTLYRILFLNLTFGRGHRNSVRIHAHAVKNRKSHVTLTVPSKTKFTIYNQ